MKVYSILLGVFLSGAFILLVSCKDKNEDLSIIGLWEGTFEVDGLNKSQKEIFEGMSQGGFEIEFKDSNILNMVVFGMEVTGSYEHTDDNLIINAQGIDKEIDIINDKLILDLEGNKVVFVKVEDSKRKLGEQQNQSVNNYLVQESNNINQTWRLIGIEGKPDTRLLELSLIHI